MPGGALTRFTKRRRLVGEIGRKDIINVYNHEILRQGSLGLKFIQSEGAGPSSSRGYVDLPDGFEINIIRVPESMQGQTLINLDIRNSYGVTVVAVNRSGDRGQRKVIIPDSEAVLKAKDMLVVLGKAEDLKRLKDALAE